MPITKKFVDTICRFKLLDFKESLLLGVSGGADSLAMLFLFAELRKVWGVKVYVAHLDHGLRKDSGRDLSFVKEICSRLGIPFYGQRVQLKGRFKKGSLEENCRLARQEFLMRIAKGIGAKAIALGHTRDDQAETVLMHLLRGSGLLGLAGILPKRTLYGFKFIRPLIEIERREIEAYLKRLKVKPREDATNKEQRFFRNRIRHDLLPRLKKYYNPKVKGLLADSAQIYAADYDYILARAAKEFKRCAVTASNGLRIDLWRFRRLHPSLQKMILRLAIEKIKGNTRRLTFGHWKEIEDLVLNRRTDSIVDLPQGISVRKGADFLALHLRKP